MIIGLASPRVATSLDDGLDRIQRLASEASTQGARIVCFPEAYLPGLHGVDLDVLPFGPADETRVLESVGQIARTHRVAVILGMELLAASAAPSPPAPLPRRGERRLNVAVVFDDHGRLLGCQAKTQIAPTEDPFYVPGNGRQLFEIDGVKFGIAICHEGWRYPETVRWAAVRGAQVVFHPYHTGSDREGIRLTYWGSPEAPYYEKASVCRSIENTIYFAGVNYALRFQESATCLIAPDGACLAHLPYGEEGVLVQKLDLDAATGLLAKRFAPERLQEI